MFSGIVEGEGRVEELKKDGSNLHLTLTCDFTNELKIDQSVSHNGVCLTIVSINGDKYGVDVIEESLSRSNLGQLKKDDIVNLERCLRLNDRIDGHLVQGHVDQTARLKNVQENDGSWTFYFQLTDLKDLDLIIEKGSIAVNGVSLTISSIKKDGFEVSVIPYTYNHTNFCQLAPNDLVNIEFDILGKYARRMVKS